MASEAKIFVRSTVLPTAYVAVFFAAVKAHFKNLHIKNAKIVSFESKKPGRVHIFIYWFKFNYISVVACGKTAEGWHNTPCDLSIGVNDAKKWGVHLDWLVVINRKFTPEREQIIKDSRPNKFFTTIDYWKKLFPKAETLRLQRFSKHVKKGHVYSSRTSPFVALSLAFNAGAKDVILFGVDLVSHSVIKDKLRDYELRQFERFCRELAKLGTQVWVSSYDSSLSKFLPVWPSIPERCLSILNEASKMARDLPVVSADEHLKRMLE